MEEKKEVAPMRREMTDEREELIKLRVAVARLAQRAGLARFIPGTGSEAPFEELVRAADSNHRGWHDLVNRLCDAVPEQAAV